jgi:Glyoxalase-like domain
VPTLCNNSALDAFLGTVVSLYARQASQRRNGSRKFASEEVRVALEIETLIIDCLDVEAMSRFWCRALDFEDVWTGPYGGHLLASKNESQIRLGLMPSRERKVDKNRLHLDLRPTDQPVEVRRLEELGAQRVDIGQTDVPWVVMADPEGNEFCVLRSRT